MDSDNFQLAFLEERHNQTNHILHVRNFFNYYTS